MTTSQFYLVGGLGLLVGASRERDALEVEWGSGVFSATAARRERIVHRSSVCR